MTNCFSGHEKGTLEGRVKDIRRQCFSKSYPFSSAEVARSHLTHQLIRLDPNSQIVEEKEHLLTYRPSFELAEILQCRVNKYSVIQYETNAYSVPDYLVGHTMQLKVYREYFMVYANHEEVCRHKKIEGSHQCRLDIYHSLKTLRKKPEALKHSLVFQHTPDLKAFYDLYYKESPREFLEKLDQHKALPKDQLMTQLFQHIPVRKTISLSQETEAITAPMEADWHRLNAINGLERGK